MRPFAILLAAALLALGNTASGQSAPASLPFQSISHTLAPGTTPNTFAFMYTGTVQFTQEPAYPVTVSLTDWKRQTIASITVKDGAPFTLSRDLPPGSYQVESEVAPQNDALYWQALGPEIFITAQGQMTSQPYLTGTTLLHQKKIEVLAPAPMETTVTDPRPLLKWQALPGAASYRVNWFEEDAPFHIVHRGSGTTTATEFRLTEDLVPKRQYEWGVWANDANGAGIGYWSAAYFFSAGGKDAFQHLPQQPTKPTPGMPYLGVAPLVLIDAQGQNPRGGVEVRSVGPNSPALKAGLQPQDILTRFNGHDLKSVSQLDFIQLVRAVAPGTTVPIDYLRDGVAHRTEVTIEAMP